MNRTQLRQKIQAIVDTVNTAKTGCLMPAALAAWISPVIAIALTALMEVFLSYFKVTDLNTARNTGTQH